MSASRGQRFRFVPQLEALNDRIVPAGVVVTNFVNHMLTITGDNNSQNLALLGAGVGHVSISAQDGETIQGKNSFVKVRQVILKLNDGDDTVTLVDLRLNKFGSLVKFQGGAGNDTLNYDGKNIDILSLVVNGGTGTFTMAPTAPVVAHFGSININCPQDACDIILGGMTVDGAVTVVTGDGADDLFRSDDCNFNGTFTLNTGGGADTIVIGNLDQNDGEELIFAGAVVIKMGDGDDSFTAGVTVHDPGNDDLKPDFTRFKSTAIFDGGTGSDTLDVFHPRSTEFALDDSPVADNWEVIVYNP